MNQHKHSDSSVLKYVLVALAALLMVMLICSSSFGLGLLAGRISFDDVISVPDVQRPVRPADQSESGSLIGENNLTSPHEAPENFDVFWEALELINENFDGEVPGDAEVTYAAVEGIMHVMESCDPGRTAGYHLKAADIPGDAPANFDYFWQTVDQVYVDCGDQIPSPDELVYLAVSGVIERLDDHYTAILSPQRADAFRIDISGDFEGIGSTVQPVDEEAGTGVMIVYPFPGSPAVKAGLRRNDEIVAVDDIDVTSMKLDDAVSLIRGPADSTVVLSVKRDQAMPFDVEIRRDRIEIPVLESEITDDKLLLITLFDFSDRSAEEMQTALEQGIESGVDGIIFDMRGNPGGRLDMSISISSMFIEDGVIVSESGGREVEHKAHGKAIIGDLPLVVLVDAASASASEIVAGAIQDYERGILIGETTFGKGSVQTLFDLSDDSILRVTTSRWFTPKGRQIDGKGLEPDLTVEFNPDQPTDTQLQAAIDYLLDRIQSQ